MAFARRAFWPALRSLQATRTHFLASPIRSVNTVTESIDGLLQELRAMPAAASSPNITSLFQELRAMSVAASSPNLISYASLIDSLVEANQIDEALSLVRKVREMGCSPDRTTLNTLIAACVKVNKFSAAVSLLAPKEVCSPDTDTDMDEEPICSIDTLEDRIEGLMKEGEQDIAKEGCILDSTSYIILLDYLLEAKDSESNVALSVLSEMAEHGHNPGQKICAGIIGLMITEGKAEEAMEWLQKMKSLGWLSTHPASDA